jgi:hypothetical protein
MEMGLRKSSIDKIRCAYKIIFLGKRYIVKPMEERLRRI